MMRFRLRLILAFAVSVVSLSAAKGENTHGFTFCAAPPRPPCVDKIDAEEAACDIEVQAFVAAVFKYRECLGVETERAVREANDVIEAWKCRSGKKDCRN